MSTYQVKNSNWSTYQLFFFVLHISKIKINARERERERMCVCVCAIV